MERAERRFGFELTRLEDQGAIDLSLLEQELHAPHVIGRLRAVFERHTDGISDDVPRPWIIGGGEWRTRQ